MPVVRAVNRPRAIRGVAAVLAILALQACGDGRGVATSQCGEHPRSSVQSGISTPAVATSLPSATAEHAVVIGVWSDCIRPETASARAGQLVQWQAVEAGTGPEIVLEDGTSLGRIQHVLEYRFGQLGTYRYEVRSSPRVTGTIIVR